MRRARVCIPKGAPLILLGLGLGLGLGPGCYSGAGDENQDSNGDGDGDGDGDANCEADVVRDPGPTPLRRLTHTQYHNTVADLFPGVDMPNPAILTDPKAHGFENFGELQTPSALLIEQYQGAAVEVTLAALAQADTWMPCAVDGGNDPVGCGHAVLEDLAGRAFRRPLSGDELDAYLGFFDQAMAENDFEVGLALAMQAVLQAPEFLYFFEFDGTPVDTPVAGDVELTRLDDYAIASRLSYFLWDTMPDATLLDAAAAGELGTPEQIEAQARRMLDSDRSRVASVNFHRQWLDFERIDTINLDPETYPAFDDGLRDDMREGLSRFVEHVVFDSDGTVQELLTSPQAPVTGRLAEVYGVDEPDSEWAVAELDPSERAGLLTNAAWLSSRAHAVHPSPVQRGVFVLERLLCEPPPAPPPEVDTNPPEPSEGEGPNTNRERYAEHTFNATCQACHQRIDGIGFGFENYDSLGRWRTMDNGFDVDATGELLGTDVDGTYENAVELAGMLGQSQKVRECMVTQYFRYAQARSETADDLCQRRDLEIAFEETGGDIKELLVSVVTSDAFRHRQTEAGQ